MFQKVLCIGFLLTVAAGQIFEMVTTFFIVKGPLFTVYVVENIVMIIFFLVIYRKIRFKPQSMYGPSKNRSAWFC